MTRTILILALLVVASTLIGCRSGPGSDCDCCATAEAAPAGDGSQAAAAAASGGQRANNAPFAEDTARLAPRTQITRGAGDITSSSADTETREVASGGAQNLGLLIPTSASASNEQSGGVSAAVQEAAKSVAAARRAYQMAAIDPSVSDARLEFLADQVTKAQEMLNAASASAKANITNNYNMGGDNTLIGYSKSGTAKDAETPGALKVLGKGVDAALAKPGAAGSSAPADKPKDAPGTGDGE